MVNAGVVVAVATETIPPVQLTLVTVPDPPPPEYCGMLSVFPTNVAAPDVPVVVSVIGA
jgi:hypothetical protein